MVDRVSSLPDEVLCHILSFLPTEDVFVTNLVSKRWRPLWLSVPTLDLDEIRCSRRDIRLVGSHSSFMEFVDASILRRGIHQPIKTLRLQCRWRCPVFKVNEWLKAAADRKVENLQFYCSANWQYLPCTIFSITTLVVLKLRRVDFRGFSSVELPSLKSLHLDDLRFSKTKHLIELLNSFPNLETLEAKDIWFHFDDPSFKGKGKLKPLSKLVRADLSLNMTKKLVIYNIDEFVLEFGDADIPIFPNLIHFELILEGIVKMEAVLYLLNHCPQLQTFVLVVKSSNMVWPNTPVVPECFSSQLQTCTIYEGAECEITFEEQFGPEPSLKNMGEADVISEITN
ncbi:F-box/LRR-repeat protein At3g59190-like [Lotus japonicus]|uniref:F-box/LRR-repeat protein At3g59190-like n=1 Tax=Lotus japonicus TaxID=34305 RepID=UPI00258BB630|nr:F-box/LRR-repeat protein At3g59190-like [Lotus japonicus]